MIERYTRLQKIKNGKIMVKEKNIRSYPTHWHEFYEVELILSGSGSYIIDGVTRNIERNMLFFMTPQDFHKVITDASEVITLMFMPEACDIDILFNLSSVFDAGGVLLSVADVRYFEAIMRELNVASCENDDEYSFYLLNSILGKMCRLKNSYKQSRISKAKKAMLYVQNNFRNNITLDDVACFVDLAPSYLSSLFLKECGINFKDYLGSIRYDYVKRLLEYSNMTVTDICYESGFCDYANFERNFKKRFCISPTDYRKSKVGKII